MNSPAPQHDSWSYLCEEFEQKRRESTPSNYGLVIDEFVVAARKGLKGDVVRLREALEIAGDMAIQASLAELARVHYAEALASAERDHAWEEALRLAAKLADLESGREQWGLSIQMYHKALDFADLALDTASKVPLLNGLGSACRRAGRSAEAISAYSEAMDLISRTVGEPHPDFATAANNLGVACMDRGDLLRAENLHLQALAIRERSFGGVHPDVAQSMGNLAAVYHASRDHTRAEAYYRLALDTYRRLPNEDPASLTAIQDNYESLLKEKSRQ